MTAAATTPDVSVASLGSSTGSKLTLPALGEVPAEMDAWVIRRERQGEPLQSFQREKMQTPEPGPGEVLVLVMAAGINYNGIWAGLGKPVSMFENPISLTICGSHRLSP